MIALIKSMYRRIRYILPVTFVLWISGCGTTHHFLPAQPLEAGKWEIQVTWHADFNDVYDPLRSIIFPEVSAYLGLGRGWNLGGGGYAIFPASHLSVAKYFSTSTDRYTTIYAHAAGPLVFTSNPRYECGVLFSSIMSDISSQYGFGMGFFQREAWRIRNHKPQLRTGPFPVLKAMLRTQAFGISWANYVGRTKSSVEAALYGKSDTVLNVAASAIDSIVPRQPGFCGDGFAVYFNDGGFKFFERWCGYPDVFYDGPLEFARWMDNRFEIYLVGGSSDHEVFLNYSELVDKYQSGERIFVRQIPEIVFDRVRRIQAAKDDNTFGISVFAHPH